MHTGVERRGNRVEHVGVHVGVNSPVRVGVVASSDQDGVALSDSDGDEVDGRFFDVNLWRGCVNFLQGREDGIIRHTPSASMMRMSWPSIQKKKAANALVFTIRRR